MLGGTDHGKIYRTEGDHMRKGMCGAAFLPARETGNGDHGRGEDGTARLFITGAACTPAYGYVDGSL